VNLHRLDLVSLSLFSLTAMVRAYDDLYGAALRAQPMSVGRLA